MANSLPQVMQHVLMLDIVKLEMARKAMRH